jgi:hypothetical protein
MSRNRAVLVLLLTIAPACPDRPAGAAAWRRLPLDGAPVAAIAADGARVAVAGPAGLFVSLDQGQRFRRREGLRPLQIPCGAMDLALSGDELVFRCVTPGAPHLFCQRLPLDEAAAPRACTEADQKGGGPAVERRAAEAERRAAPFRRIIGAGAARLCAARAGKLVLVGHEHLGLYRSTDSGRRFSLVSAGLDGLAAVAFQKGPDDKVLIALAAPAGSEGRLVKAGEAACTLGAEPSCTVQPAEELKQPAFPEPLLPQVAPAALTAGLAGQVPGPIFAFWPQPQAHGRLPLLVGTERGAYLRR